MFITRLQRLGYRYLLKPVFFYFDPEWVHDRACTFGEKLGRLRFVRTLCRHFLAYAHPSLHQDLLGIFFPNPIGLTAGFDKNGRLTDIIPDIGFGYEIIGSVTAQSCEGNAKPRLWRLPMSQGLVVYYGLKNDGAQYIRQGLLGKKFRIPLGVSIAKTNIHATLDTNEGIEDYKKGIEIMKDIGDFLAVNISCPNAFGGEPFTDPERLDLLLSTLDLIQTKKPRFLKIAVDISCEELGELIKVMDRHKVDGLIIANLTKHYDRDEIVQQEISADMKGGISGRPTSKPSDRLIAHAYRMAGDRYIIVGVGGVFSAGDAYEKMRQGASLVQLATGMIFEGPQLIGEINRGLVQLMKHDGFHTISEVVGSAHR